MGRGAEAAAQHYIAPSKAASGIDDGDLVEAKKRIWHQAKRRPRRASRSLPAALLGNGDRSSLSRIALNHNL